MVEIIEFSMLVLLEMILSFDNIIFLSLTLAKAPENQKIPLRIFGLSMALILRILFVYQVETLSQLSEPILYSISIQSIIYFSGGIFLCVNSIKELFRKHNENDCPESSVKPHKSFIASLLKVLYVDVIFSIDSVITLVGIVDSFETMIYIVSGSYILILFTLPYITTIINKHPFIKDIALIFILIIGGDLILRSFHLDISKHYVYFIATISIIIYLIISKISIRKA